MRMRQLQSLARELTEAGRARDHRVALEKSRELRGHLARLGLESGWALWMAAVMNDYLGDPAEALQEIRKALPMDPLNPDYVRSFEIITTRLKHQLAELPPSDPSVPRLYALLAESGDNDVHTHLAMTRHLLSSGAVEKARRLLDALTLLAPASREVWLERAKLERREGNEAEAARCELEAWARSTKDIPFGIPRAP